WLKTVEMASDFAVTEVFSLKKPHSGISSQTIALKNTEQLLDHDEAYGEAQALLSDWMNSMLRLELEMDVIVFPEKNSPQTVELTPPAIPCFLHFNEYIILQSVGPYIIHPPFLSDLYSHLAEEEDLMEWEVVDSGIVQDLRRGMGLTMEACHHGGVCENRAMRDAERERLHREREARRQAREEAQRREQEGERRRRQEARKQEEMVQQEMVRLRCEMEEEEEPGAANQVNYKRVCVCVYFQCLQRYFSGWYCVLLERRLRMGKEAALYDWKRELRAWRALVWAGREQREAERTEEELQIQNSFILFSCDPQLSLQKGQVGSRSAGPAPSPACQGNGQLGAVVPPTLPWQVTRRHAALSAGDVGAVPRSRSAELRGGRFERRHTSQQQTIPLPLFISLPRSLPLSPPSTAMEECARQRAERRREVEELKRKKEEERIVRNGVFRPVGDREQENQRRFEREQQLQTQAQQHYHRTLLLRRGLAPWKRRVAMSQANTPAVSPETVHPVLAAGESLAQKWASAKQLYQHILLRRSLGNWKRLKDHRMVLEVRANRFWHTHTLRRALIALLDQVTQGRMVEWDQEQQAQGHSDRRAVRSCFQAWRQYPGWLREERERETRREKLRRRVAEVLPDFRSSPLNCQWV
uniref:Coiled-coil domain containing 191 n=1 Tax=Hucho hucho TaxID=62062 RepID=A0A4W5NS83_9TELE